jgi:hypothetical protein
MSTASKKTVPTSRFFHDGEKRNMGILVPPAPGMRFSRIHPFLEELNDRMGTSFKLVEPRFAHRAFQDLLACKMFASRDPIVLDGIIGYEKGKNKLRDKIVFAAGDQRVIMQTGKYAGESRIALSAVRLTSSDLEVGEKEILVAIPESRIIPIENFPPEPDWHLLHSETKIPHGKQDRSSEFAKYLDRVVGPYVGPFARHHFCGRDWLSVPANFDPSKTFRVAVEILESDLAKFVTIVKRIRRFGGDAEKFLASIEK